MPPQDIAQYAFSESAPWTIEREKLAWAQDLDAIRKQTLAELPALLRRRRVPPVGRFLEAATRLGGALLGWQLRERRQGGSASRLGLSHRLRDAFEHLGSPYIKLGQILSSGKGIFPDELVSEFKTLRDQVRPEPWPVVRQVVEEDFGQPLDAVFESFDQNCLAAASIAQVHAARLRTGEDVVVKVQRPRVATLVRQDVQGMAWIAPLLVGRIPIAALANPPALVELFAETILEELDFRLEAENMLDIARIFAEAGQRIIIVPRPHPRWVTRRVLVMERLSGFTYEKVEDMRNAGIDTSGLLRALIIAFLEGAMIYGAFHGDLHGGNLFVTPEGKIALFDYGMTARMDETRRLAFLRLMMLGMMGNLRGQIEAYKDLGALKPDTDVDELIRVLKLDQPVIDPTTLTSDQLTHEIQYVTKALMGYGAKLPKPLMLFVKNMLFIDDAVAHLAPDVNIFEEVIHIYAYFAQNHADKISTEAGMDPTQHSFDLTMFKAGIGLRKDVETITHRDLQKRREVIREKLDRKEPSTAA
jgi:ubiquinone biosynthesis protein